MKTQDRTIKIANSGYEFDEKAHLHTLDGKPLTGVTTVLSVIAKPALIQWAANMACDYIEEKLMFETDWLNVHKADFANLLKEARTAHKKKKESAGTHGTEVHSLIESHINKIIEHFDGYAKSLRLYTEQNPSVVKFIEWAKENDVKFLASEKHVYSRLMWTGGICDIICEIDGKRYVGDIKTSSAIYPEHFIQASAYAEMLKEMGDYKDEHEPMFPTALILEKLKKPAFDGVVIINLDKKGGFDVKFNYDLEGNLNCFKAALTLYRHLIEVKNQSLN